MGNIPPYHQYSIFREDMPPK